MRTNKVLNTFLWISLGIMISQLLQFHIPVKFAISPFMTDDMLLESWSTREHSPFLFIGGYENSGAEMLGLRMNAHPWIRCGTEFILTEEVLQIWKRHCDPPNLRAIEAGIYPIALTEATKAFIRKTIEGMRPTASLLCHVQPMTFRFLRQLGYFFPDAKFIHVVRDGRGAITAALGQSSVVDYNQTLHLKYWEENVTEFLSYCAQFGSGRCMNVRYESLLLQSESEFRKISEFIDVPWDPIILKSKTISNESDSQNSDESNVKHSEKTIDTSSLLAWSEPSSPMSIEVQQTSCKEIKLLKRLNYCPHNGYIPNYSAISPVIV